MGRCSNLRKYQRKIELHRTKGDLRQLVNGASCEIQTDMNGPTMYIHCIQKLGLTTKRRLISQGAFQPKAHDMNEKQFLKSRCGSIIVLSMKAGTTLRLEITVLEEKGCRIHQRKMLFFVTFIFWSQ